MNGDGFGSPPWGPADPVPELEDTQALPGLGRLVAGLVAVTLLSYAALRIAERCLLERVNRHLFVVVTVCFAALSVLPREIAVVGCGIVGLTTAVVALQAGLKVTVYARDPMARYQPRPDPDPTNKLLCEHVHLAPLRFGPDAEFWA